jgi:hypothetical protein
MVIGRGEASASLGSEVAAAMAASKTTRTEVLRSKFSWCHRTSRCPFPPRRRGRASSPGTGMGRTRTLRAGGSQQPRTLGTAGRSRRTTNRRSSAAHQRSRRTALLYRPARRAGRPTSRRSHRRPRGLTGEEVSRALGRTRSLQARTEVSPVRPHLLSTGKGLRDSTSRGVGSQGRGCLRASQEDCAQWSEPLPADMPSRHGPDLQGLLSLRVGLHGKFGLRCAQ